MLMGMFVSRLMGFFVVIWVLIFFVWAIVWGVVICKKFFNLLFIVLICVKFVWVMVIVEIF